MVPALCVLATVPLGAQEPQTVEIKGSMRLGLAGEGASPVTIILADDLARAGITTAEQALRRLAANQSDQGVSQNIGEFTGGLAEADLRGLGADKTLVLLNGRRVSNHAYDGGAVDLNAIPLSAIERIEVMRDGASAIHGSAAISGVINFVLRRAVTGFDLLLETEQPRARGGDMSRASVLAGFGELQTQGYNVFGTLDVRRQDALQAKDRVFSRSGVVRSAEGGFSQFRTGSTSFPGDLDGFEPSLAAGCAPPRSIPDPDGEACRYDYASDIDLIPQNEQTTLLAGAKVALGARHELTFELLRARNATRSTVSSAPVSTVILATSPYWIARRPSSDVDGLGRGGVASWLTVAAGPRTSQSLSVTRRMLAVLEGVVGDADYQVGVGRSRSGVSDSLIDGHVDINLLRQGVLAGEINPFGAQSPRGDAAIRAARIAGTLVQAQGAVDTLDARIDVDLLSLPGGAVAASAGFEYRRERFDFNLMPIAARTAGSGLDLSSDTQGARQGAALWASLRAPLTPSIEASLAARLDRTSDAASVRSPKVGLRWHPTPEFVVRGSINGGFRVPTLYELYQPRRTSLTTDSFDDPLLCPHGAALAGLPAGVVCDQQLLVRSGGPVGYGKAPSALKPERSRMLTLGGSSKPAEGWALGVDFWWLRLRDEIDVMAEDAILGAPARFGSRIVRCSQIDAAERSAIAPCLNPAGFDPIAFIDLPIENLGQTQTQGVDLSLRFDAARTGLGDFSFAFEGTYVDRHERQSAPGGERTRSVGRFADDVPIFRWQHSAQIELTDGAWSGVLAQRFKSGYADQHPGNRVAPYSLIDGSVSYRGIPRMVLTAGIKNLFDTRPPFSNQDETLQPNFDPRFTDPIGRALVFSLAYRFF